MSKIEEPELSATASELMSANGLANALAGLVQELRAGGTRDQISALIAIKHCLKMFHELQVSQNGESNVKEVLTELRATQKLIKQDHGGASLSFENPPSLPIERSGESN